MSGKEMSSDGIEKQRSQRSARRQANSEMANKDGDTEEATTNLQTGAANLAAEITRKVAAMMEEKLSEFSDKLDFITAIFEQDSQRMVEAENHISDVEDVIASLENRLTKAEGKLEARSRRYNIRIFGVKEGSEGRNPLSFFETWLPKILNLETKKSLRGLRSSFGRTFH